MRTRPLAGIQIVNLATNLPGPFAVFRLRQLGATVTKVEPPEGDHAARVAPRWYQEMKRAQRLLRADLHTPAGREALHSLLARADLLITANRPSALKRLGLGWQSLHRRFPRLCQVAIIGYAAPREEEPGHDLTYQARLGLLSPPRHPRTLLADLACAERVVSASALLLLERERGKSHTGKRAYVAISESLQPFAMPLDHGLTSREGPLSGALPNYRIYPAKDGWIALAALENKFWEPLIREFKLENLSSRERIRALARSFRARTAAEWDRWARARGLPLAAVLLNP